MTPNTHVTPGYDVTGDPRQPIDDSFRSRKRNTQRILLDGNILIVNPNIPIHISGCGELFDDELTIEYTDNHVFEIAFDSNKVSVVLKSEQRAGERG